MPIRRIASTPLIPTAALLATLLFGPAHADTSLDPALQARLRGATFEVVMHKAEADSLSYEKPLPLERLPYSERTDRYMSVGTAFAIAPNTYVSAAHVFLLGVNTQFGEPALRDSKGEVHTLDQVLKFSDEEDFIVFTLKQPFAGEVLTPERAPVLDAPVYTAGNALGEGIVVRAGLLTSLTPEEVDGRWKWLRFSAAASPGNSGGPLLDAQGHVLGVVLRKSENENLNYAAPIDLVLDAPPNVARIGTLSEYVLPVLDEKEVERPHEQFPLPVSYSEFARALRTSSETTLDRLQARLLAKQSENMFPNGPGARRVLFAADGTDPLAVIVRGVDGNWVSDGGKAEAHAELAHNGDVTIGTLAGGMGVILRKPDDIQADVFYADSKAYMDMVLKALQLWRPVGSERVRITSLGPAKQSSTFTDAFGRIWQVRSWNIEFLDAQLLSYAMATPQGYEAMVRFGNTASMHEANLDLRAMTNFMDVSLQGSLAQWRGYLTQKPLLPGILRSTQIDFDYAHHFRYRSPRVSLGFDAPLLTLAGESPLELHCGYFEDHGKVVWDVVSLSLQEQASGGRSIVLRRNARPDPTLPETFQTQWRKLSKRAYPFDASPIDDDGRVTIDTIASAAASATSGHVLYEVAYGNEGHHPDAEMKAALSKWLKAVHIDE